MCTGVFAMSWWLIDSREDLSANNKYKRNMFLSLTNSNISNKDVNAFFSASLFVSILSNKRARSMLGGDLTLYSSTFQSCTAHARENSFGGIDNACHFFLILAKEAMLNKLVAKTLSCTFSAT